MRFLILFAPLLVAGTIVAQTQRPSGVADFISVDTPVFVLEHVRVIDGTGTPAKEDQAVVIVNGKIQFIGPDASAQIPPGAQRIERSGYTVIPGLVGMHDHLFYSSSNALQRGTGPILEPGVIFSEIAYTAPRLYLAAGVTTLRTTGSVDPYTDIKVRSRIESGRMPGPELDLTAPYLEGVGTSFAQMHELSGADEARQFVRFWAQSGMTSFKAYMHITRAELAAATSEIHALGFKITGHLCSVTWPEAVRAGIDNLEHGPVFTDSELMADKKIDICPNVQNQRATWISEPIDGPRVTALIELLVSHHVAVTSTLPVRETSVAGNGVRLRRILDAMSSASRESYLMERALLDPTTSSNAAVLLRKEMDFEIAFVKAGGLLLAGPVPTGNGGVLPGFGDQREIELLVEAGFTPVEAIHIATENGALYLGQQNRIGTLAPGKQADLVLIKGDPSKRIDEIENVETVFRAGTGYDSKRLIDSVRGQVGIR